MAISSTSRPSIVTIETSSPSPSLSPVSNQSDDIDEILSRNGEIPGEKADTEPRAESRQTTSASVMSRDTTENIRVTTRVTTTDTGPGESGDCGEDCRFSSDDAVILTTTDATNLVTSAVSRDSTLQDESRETSASVTSRDITENIRVISSDVTTRVTTIRNNDSLSLIGDSTTESSSQRVTTQKPRVEDSNITFISLSPGIATDTRPLDNEGTTPVSKIIYLFDEKTEQNEQGGNILPIVVTESSEDKTTPVSKITFIFNGTQSQEVSQTDDTSSYSNTRS